MHNYLFILCCCIGCSLLTTQCSSLQALTGEPTTTTTTTSRSGNASERQLRQNIVNYALDQRGVSYKYAGRSPRTGFDCSGFTHYVYDAFDLNITPVSRVQETEGRKVNLTDAQAGDLIFFRKSRAGTVFHVALVVDNTREGIIVVHSTSSRGVIRENISTSSYWKNKISTARDMIN